MLDGTCATIVERAPHSAPIEIRNLPKYIIHPFKETAETVDAAGP